MGFPELEKLINPQHEQFLREIAPRDKTEFQTWAATRELNEMRRLLWMVLTEQGGDVFINKDTKENYPGDDRIFIERTEQPASGTTVLSAKTAAIKTAMAV